MNGDQRKYVISSADADRWRARCEELAQIVQQLTEQMLEAMDARAMLARELAETKAALEQLQAGKK